MFDGTIETAASGNLLAFGVLLGMRHAMESDHLAAVAALATRSRTMRQTAWQGIAWGGGHAATLLLFGGVVLAMSRTVPAWFAQALEVGVGIMLVLLGIDVLRRFLMRGGPDRHHPPVAGLGRAVVVGMMHGMAGSAALAVLAATKASSAPLGLAYIMLFGVGSIVGMVLLSMVIAVPLRRSARYLQWAQRGLQLAIGSITLAVGVLTIGQHLSVFASA